MIKISTIPSLVLSASIGEVVIQSDKDYVDLQFGTASNFELLVGRFYTYKGAVTVDNLRDVVELAIREAGTAMLEFALVATNGDEEATVQFHALHFDRHIALAEPEDLQQMLKSHFLTVASARRIAPKSTVLLSWVVQPMEDMAYSAHCDYIADGVNGYCTLTLGYENAASSALDVVTVAVDCAKLEAMVASMLGKKVQLTAFTVTCGDRAATFFIATQMPQKACFYFRNAFNVPDLVAIPAETTAKTTVERSVAVLNERSQFYDSTCQHSFEVQSAALTHGECALAQQLFTADDARVLYGCLVDEADFDAMQRILITDSTCEVSDFPEKPNSVKFTWRFDVRRIALPNPEQSGIFTEPYNYVFT